MTHCVKKLDVLYSLAITDFILDAVIIMIPIPLESALVGLSKCRLFSVQMWSLYVTTGRNFVVSMVFLLGSV